tara:strand:+ start:1505 stop:1876 length:372 start_codon:yes stop_codon:yes gene_type:complete
MNNGNDNNHVDDLYQGKSDHEVILILETQVQDLIKSLDKSQKQNSNLLKTQGQISVVRLVFIGVLILVGCMVCMSVISWWSPKGTIGIEKELAFFERLLLVLLGILSSAVVALYDQRNNGKEG